MTSTRQGGQFKAPPLHPLDRNRRLALAYVDDRLFDAGIEGGPVAWLHDEIVLEVREDYADRAVEIFKQAMVDGFRRDLSGRANQRGRRASDRLELGRGEGEIGRDPDRLRDVRA